jgi:hypothetical protein
MWSLLTWPARTRVAPLLQPCINAVAARQVDSAIADAVITEMVITDTAGAMSAAVRRVDSAIADMAITSHR